MSVSLSVFVLLPLLLQVESLFKEDSCFTDDQAGTCKLVSECQPLMDEIKMAGVPIPNHLREKLQNINCGFEGSQPIVCCVASTILNPVPSIPDWLAAGPVGGAVPNIPSLGRPVPSNDNAINTNTNTRNPQVPTQIDNSGNRNNNNNANRPADVQRHRNIGLLPSDVCGVAELDKIVGGRTTSLYELPWMVLLSYSSARGPLLSCGGTLISKWYVLTAAHCVSFLGSRLTLSSVILGEHDVRQDPDCARIESEVYCAPKIKNIPIGSVVAHPGYSPQTLFDDIALIRLSQPADFSLDSIKPICLPITPELQRDNLAGKKCSVAGWGATESGLQSPVLLTVNLPVLTNEQCQMTYNGTPRIYDTQMCAGGLPDMDSCGGDSGGPLIFPGSVGENGLRFVQRGIVSYGSKRCGVGGFPGVYTRVAYYMDWILDNMHS